MGQSLSLSHPSPPVRLATHRQSLKRVYSEDGAEDGKRSVSMSLPASPSIRRRTVSPEPGSNEVPESPSKVPLSFESMLKNLEEFAQHQWPTWAKRRGWSTDVSPELATSSTTDDGSGRVVQVDKDKWIFLRHRKKCTPSISPVSIPVETVVEEDGLNSAVANMVGILQIDENRIVTAVGGQRSRRSSGYASASSSPSAVKRALELQTSTTLSTSTTTAPLSSSVVPHEENNDDGDDWRLSSLYEVTLRWMFDAGSEESRPLDDVVGNAAILNDSGTADEIAASPVVGEVGDSSAEIIRLYLHFFCHQKNKLPSFIDFRPIPVAPLDGDGSDVRHAYTLVFQDGSSAPQTSFPIELACDVLIQQIVESHPQLVDWEPRKLAMYEKSWQPGKTSRARLRRLNDFDCPLLLARQWQTSGASENSTANCAKTLILQPSQNGDIPWEEFTVAELSSFLKVLDREEKNYEMQIREKYQLLNERLRETMQLSNPSVCHST